MVKETKTSQLKPSSRPQVVRVKQKRKARRFVGLLGLSLIVAGATVFAAFNYFNSKPEKVLADALVASIEDFSSKRPAGVINEIALDMKGEQPLRLNLKLNTMVTHPQATTDAVVDIAFAGKTHTAQAEIRVVSNDELYFRLTNLKTVVDGLAQTTPEVASYRRSLEPLLSKLDNVWVLSLIHI